MFDYERLEDLIKRGAISSSEVNLIKNMIGIIKEQEKLINEYEDVISSIANIDGAFIDGNGDCNYTDGEALKLIEEIVNPIWINLAEERNLTYD
jgi:hypothetical protein